MVSYIIETDTDELNIHPFFQNKCPWIYTSCVSAILSDISSDDSDIKLYLVWVLH